MRTYRAQKSALTRAINSGDHARVIAECERAFAEFETLPFGYPDDWHRWNIAHADAEIALLREQYRKIGV